MNPDRIAKEVLLKATAAAGGCAPTGARCVVTPASARAAHAAERLLRS